MRKICLAALTILLAACNHTPNTPNADTELETGTALKHSEAVPTAVTESVRAEMSGADVAPTSQRQVARCVKRASANTNQYTVSKQFTGTANDTLSLGGARLCVPAEGMKSGMRLSITPLDSASLPQVPAGLANVTAGGGGFRFLPHGEHFKRFAKVVIPFDSVRIPKGYTAKDIRTYYYNEENGKWTVLPKDSINEAKQLASALTTHFTDMINGIITVPETPDAQGYAPTTISDIKAADPSAGKLAVQTPQPNNNGTASLQIPFNFPKGRAGMGPNVSVTYSNEGGSGWCGYGWSVNTPAISIDTRWGVPLYSTQLETESYLFNGEQFTDRAYRKVDMLREADKRFYLRRETDFAEIVRKGDAPTNYTWEVKHLDGTTDFYKAVEADSHGNIAKWGLAKTTDAHGNCVTYEYDTENGTAYIKSINYTGFGNEKGAYTLVFNRTGNRTDKTSNGRNGFLQADNQQLTSIDVLLDDKVFRSYKFEYATGRFGKTLLTAVAETDGQGNELYRNSFKYHDDLATGGLFEGQADHYKIESKTIVRRLFEKVIDEFEDSPSLINGTSSTGFSTQGGLNIGVGAVEVVPFAGGSYSYNYSESNGDITLTDMDGDGLTDIVYREDNVIPALRQIYYRKNLYGLTGELSFADKQPVVGISSFSNTVSEGHTTGEETGIMVGENGLSFSNSFSQSHDDSRTRVYFQDFNGDGLIDVADKGTVRFSHIDKNGLVVFENHSGNTPNPIQGTGVEVVASVVGDTSKVRDSLEKAYPLLDVVRLWRAPFGGKISITSTVKVCDTTRDGVAYALQIGNKVEQEGKLKAGESNEVGGTYSVSAGDFVMFRLQSVYSGTNDQTDWSPVITYDTVYGGGILDNENNIDLASYSAERDFLPSCQPSTVAYGPCSVTIGNSLRKGRLSEDVVLKCYREDQLFYSDTLKAGDEYNGAQQETLLTENLVQGDTVRYSFEIEHQTQIDHREISWIPVVNKKRQVKGIELTEAVHIAPKRNFYNKIVRLKKPVTLSFDTADGVRYKNDSLTVSTHFSPESDNISLFVKNVRGGVIPADSLCLLDSVNGKTVYVSAYSATELSRIDAAYIAFHRTRIDSVYNEEDSTWVYTEVDTVVRKVDASVYSVFDSQQLGLLFNGWGQFALNGNEPEKAIDTDKINTCLHQYDDLQLEENGKVASGHTFDTKANYLQVMLYDVERERYTSYQASISAQGGCPTRICNPEIVVDAPSFTPAKHAVMAPYITQHTFSHSENTSASAGSGSLGASAGISSSSTYSQRHVMDLNGDRYPDWISGGESGFGSQFTRADGMISTTLFTASAFGLSGQSSNAWSAGISTGGGSDAHSQDPPSQGDDNSNTKQNDTRANQESKQAGVSYGASGNFCNTSGTSDREWIDYNGDGLPDMVYKGGQVLYNTGYAFTPFIQAGGLNNISSTESKQGGAGLTFGVNFGGHANIGAGTNYTNTNNDTDLQLTDLNGDGLPDRLYYDDNLTVEFNTGSGFLPGLNAGGRHPGRSKSVGEGAHVNVAVPISFYVMILKFTITPYFNYSTNSSVAKTLSSFTDLNGDGLPDLVFSPNENEIEVYYNRTGRTNLLDSVVLAGGARIALTYSQTRNSYDMPNRKWVLSAVEVQGGNPENGATRTRDTIIYEGGVYDRYEREFMGFGKVTVRHLDTENKDAVYRSTELTYSNKRFVEKGLLLADSTFSADGTLLSANTNTYQPVVNNGSEFLALVKTQKEQFTGGNAMTVTEDYTYDEIGNVVAYTSTAGDVVDVKVSYNDKGYLRRIPVKVSVSGGATRERTCTVNDKGDITQITLSNGNNPSVYDFTHDQYGNITQVTRPKNEQGQRLWNKFVYDGVTHSLVTEISNAYGYKAATEYDLRFGAQTLTTDINNNQIKYDYDDFGRMTRVTGPYDDDYTIKMVYAGDKATTYNHTQEGDIETVTTCDNLMRPVKVRKTAVVDGQLGYVVSGVTVLDAFGRTVKEYLPALEGQTSTYFTATEYDLLDRKVKVVTPDGDETRLEYEIADLGGQNVLLTRITDPENHVSEQYTDGRERKVKTVRKGSPEDIVVTYDFNPLGELLAVTHPNGLQTKYTYDGLGNKLSVNNPDAGLTTFTYDAVGNVVTKTTPNMAKISKGGYIKYDYDYERVSEIKYPQHIVNRVQFTYGKAGEAHNRAGRLVLVQDASGGTEHFYGKLGEEVKTIRTVLLNSADVRTYVAESEYDSWNRIRKMVYPDGETVTYGYDKAGQLNRMTSEKDGFTYDFITDMTYDVYGNISTKTYGNGTSTRYTYDPARQHLTSMVATNGAGEFINATYKYDNIDNILGIDNTAKPVSTIGGTSRHSYTYDNFSRLVSAEGGCKDNAVTYSLTMEYDVMSNPLRKNQTITNSTVATSHNLQYLYEGDKPDAASQIGEDRYTYDANGNPVLIVNDSTTRTMTWDEENRLVMLNDDGYASRYTYDYTGTRVIKSHGPLESVYINGAEQGLDYHDADNYTLYVSPYLVVNNDRFTKHYYAGTQRIASKVGSGDFYNVYGVNGFHLTAGGKDYEERLAQMEEGVKLYYRENGIPPGVPTQKGSNADPYVTGIALPNVPLGNYDVPSGWPTSVKFNPPGDVPGPPVQFESEDMGEAKAGFGFESDHTYEADWFFFHTDHLGSTSYLTDTAGNVSQFVCYTPYGEAIVDEHLTTYENPFKFSGKELDDITGLYDHGARSRNPVTTLWYGVDTLWEKSVDVGPYVYCYSNPVIFHDPTGKKDKPFDKTKDRYPNPDPKTATPKIINGKINKNAYNCHSYAWEDSKGDPTDKRNERIVKYGVTKWDDNPDNNMGGYKQLKNSEPNKPGDRVIYYVDDNKNGQYDKGEPIGHSAIVHKVDKEGNTTLVRSKMGENGISINHPGAPGFYDTFKFKSTKRAYFRKNGNEK